MNIEEYLNNVKDQIRNEKAKEFVSEELKTHIEDQIDEYINEGMSEEQAALAAVKDMGDPVNVGTSLNRIHRPHMEWRFLIFIIGLSAISLVVHFYLCLLSFGDSTNFLTLYLDQWFFRLLTTVLGIILMFAFYRIDYTILNKKSRILGICLLVILAVCGGVFGQRHSGIMSRLYIGHWASYLNHFILLFIPIFGGILYEYRGKGLSAIFKIILWMIAPLICLRIMGLNTLFIIWVIIFSEFTLLWLAIGKNWYNEKKIISLTLSGLLFFVIMLLYVFPFINNPLLKKLQHGIGWRMSKYFWGKLPSAIILPIQKIYEFFSKLINLQTILNNINIKDVIKDSNFIGSSVSAINKMDNKPIYRTDLLLGSISANFGILLMLGVILAAFVLSAYILFISLKQKNKLGFIVGSACAAAIGFESLTNILTALGIVGLSDSILPFFADGGGILICHYIFAGLVLSVYRYKDIRREKVMEKKRKLINQFQSD